SAVCSPGRSFRMPQIPSTIPARLKHIMTIAFEGSPMPRPREQADAELTDRLKATALLESCASVLGWDEQTYMPAGGAAHRANQLSLLAGIDHELATAPETGQLLAEAESPPLM